MILEPVGRRCALWRAWMRKGGAMDDVAVVWGEGVLDL
jgi:hypothetical protein